MYLIYWFVQVPSSIRWYLAKVSNGTAFIFFGLYDPLVDRALESTAEL
jgi:hypothetical protein